MIGVVLLVAIVVALAAVSGGILFSLAQERDPAPGVTMTIEDGEQEVIHRLRHENGDVLDGDRIEIRGVADEKGLAGEQLSAGDSREFVATDTSIEVVWRGDSGTTYVIWDGSVPADATAPDPDKGCPWVESESSGGADDVKISGGVVDCEVETDKVIEVNSGGVVIGHTHSENKDVDADDARFYGDVHVETNLNIQDGTISGAVTSADTVKIDNSSVSGSVDGVDTIEVVAGSSVGDDVVSDTGQVKVLDSEVTGLIATDGSVKLDGATVTGEVYVDSGDFDCTDSTIDGADCGNYTPKDPDDY